MDGLLEHKVEVLADLGKSLLYKSAIILTKNAGGKEAFLYFSFIPLQGHFYPSRNVKFSQNVDFLLTLIR